MAEITLKAYYAHVDDLLDRRAYEEAIAHCQHILGRYPKNLEALRRLGKSNLEAGLSEEASRAYVSVLRLAPFDADAFIGLGEVAQRKGLGEQAIYYLERAYEQEPTSAEAIGRLRDAHRRFTDRANAKLPTTPLIAARQQFRTGLTQQAIQTLALALESEPNRIDLKLAQARIHTQAGEGIDAVRAAKEVLKQLPECLEANEIIASFWIAQGRPSDASHFLETMEKVDPIRAYEIASGRTDEDDRFVISLLSFRPTASGAVDTSMDWLDEIGGEETNPMSTIAGSTPGSAGMSGLLNTAPKTEPASEADSMDWLTELDSQDDAVLAQKSSAQEPEPVIDGDADQDPLAWLGGAHLVDDLREAEPAKDAESAEPAEDAEDWLQTLRSDTPAAGRVSTGLTGYLDGLGDDEILDEDLSNEEPELDDFLSMMIPDMEQEDFDDTGSFLASLTDGENVADFPRSGLTSTLRAENAEPVEAVDSGADADLYVPLADVSDESARPRLSGMLASLMRDDDTPGEDFGGDPDLADIDPNDPLRWMREGISTDDVPGDGEAAVAEDTQAQLDALSVDETTTNPDDPFNWALLAGVTLTDEPTNVEVQDFLADPMGVKNPGSIEPANESPMAWTDDAGVSLDESQKMQVVDDVDADDSMAWARDADVSFLDDVRRVGSQQTAQLPELSHDDEEFDLAPESDRRQQDPTEPVRPSGLLAMMKSVSEENTQREEPAMSDTDLPDWMRDEDTGESEEAAKPAPQEEQFDWLASTGEQTEPSEETDIDWEGVTLDESESDEAAPDWLVSLEDNRDNAEYAALSAADDPATPQMWEESADEEALQEDVPDWMKTLRDEPAELTDDSDILFAEAALSTEPEDTHDDSGITVEPLPFDVIVDGSEPVVGAEEAAAENLYAESPSMERDEDDELAALFPKTETAMPPVVGDVQDWGLSDLTFEELGADAPELEFEPVAEADVDDMDIDTDMDWLRALNTAPGEDVADAGTSDESNVLEPDFALDFLEDDGGTSEIATIDIDVDDLPDWLVERKPDPTETDLDVDVPAALLAGQEEMFGEVLDDKDLYEVNKTETDMPEISAAAAVNAPDWLNALVPGVDSLGGGEADDLEDVSASEYLGGGSQEYAWISEIADDEFSAPLATPSRREARFAFTEPPVWLQRLRGATQPMTPTSTVMDADEDDLPDWLNLDEADQA